MIFVDSQLDPKVVNKWVMISLLITKPSIPALSDLFCLNSAPKQLLSNKPYSISSLLFSVQPWTVMRNFTYVSEPQFLPFPQVPYIWCLIPQIPAVICQNSKLCLFGLNSNNCAAFRNYLHAELKFIS